jgi:hypothetical protein
MESVMIRFPESAEGSGSDDLGGIWVLMETSGGHLVHCSVCPGIGPLEFSDLAGPAPIRGSEAESVAGGAAGGTDGPSCPEKDGRIHAGGA